MDSIDVKSVMEDNKAVKKGLQVGSPFLCPQFDFATTLEVASAQTH